MLPPSQTSPSSQNKAPGNQVRLVRKALAVLLLLLGLGIILFSRLSFASARAWIDRLSKDGSMERFTLDLFHSIQIPALVTGILFMATGLALVLFRPAAEALFQNSWKRSKRLWKRLRADIQGFLRFLWSIRLDRVDLILIVLLTTGAALVRLLFTGRPFSHDEAYTYIAFASRPWIAVISDYHLPNNHIFHTILVKLSTEVLGTAVWAIRFPALLAGVLCVPVSYLLARRLYSRWTGLLSAAIFSFFPLAILYGSLARGYSQFMLLTLLLFSLAVYCKDHPNLFGWILFILVAVSGFYTFPMMIYPFGGIMGWFLVTAWIKDISPAYRSRFTAIQYLLVSGAAVILFTIVLYLPVVLIGTGWHSLVGNPFVTRLSVDLFIDSLLVGITVTGDEWNMDLPVWMWTLFCIGTVLSLVFHRFISRVKVPLQLTLIAWLVVILFLQRPQVLARIWTFMVPLFVIWSAAGLVELPARLPFKGRYGMNVGVLVCISGILVMSIFGFTYSRSQFPGWSAAPDRVEQTVQFLQNQVRDGDMIVISSSDAPILAYYSQHHGIPREMYDRLEKHPEEFQRAWIVVSQREGQTIVSAVNERKLDPARFDFNSAVLRFDLDGIQVYESPLK